MNKTKIIKECNRDEQKLIGSCHNIIISTGDQAVSMPLKVSMLRNEEKRRERVNIKRKTEAKEKVTEEKGIVE